MDTKLKDFQRVLRKNMPAPELILWQRIRNNQLGVKFRRQYTIFIPHPTSLLEKEKKDEGYHRILDFYAPSVKLGIEIDGESHFINREKVLYEKESDSYLFSQYDVTVIRFLNSDVVTNTEGVLQTILDKIQSLT